MSYRDLPADPTFDHEPPPGICPRCYGAVAEGLCNCRPPDPGPAIPPQYAAGCRMCRPPRWFHSIDDLQDHLRVEHRLGHRG